MKVVLLRYITACSWVRVQVVTLLGQRGSIHLHADSAPAPHVKSSKPSSAQLIQPPLGKVLLAWDSMNNSYCVSRNSVSEMDAFRPAFLG